MSSDVYSGLLYMWGLSVEVLCLAGAAIETGSLHPDCDIKAPLLYEHVLLHHSLHRLSCRAICAPRRSSGFRPLLPPPLPVLPRAAPPWTAAWACREGTRLRPKKALRYINVGLSMRGRAASAKALKGSIDERSDS